MKHLKYITFILAIALFFAFALTACGSSEAEVASGDEATAATASVQPAADSGEAAVASDTLKTTDVVKKVVIVQETADETRENATVKMLKALENGGYKEGKNLEVTKIVVESNEKSAAEAVGKINEIKPDTVLINQLYYAAPVIAAQLEGSVPILTNAVAESFVDKDGVPLKNISGIYSMPKDMQQHAFDMLNKIAPINGKKAVFITQEGMFTKEEVTKNLQTLGIELKAYVTFKYTEEFETAIDKYNKDDEVGWTLLGLWPMLREDGTSDPIEKCPKSDYWKKPTVSYWENGVSWGFLSGLGVDLVECGAQVGEMAVKLLDGENIKNIKAAEPRKSNIMINKQRADMMNITIPAEILGSAKIFINFNGEYVK